MNHEYREADFCTQDEGIKYVFKMFSIIYGNKIANHWGDMKITAVMDVWKGMIGNYLTYRPCLDFALKNLDSKGFITNPMAFKDLCSQAGRIPDKPHSMITKQLTEAEKQEQLKKKEEALAQISKFTKGFGKNGIQTV